MSIQTFIELLFLIELEQYIIEHYSMILFMLRKITECVYFINV